MNFGKIFIGSNNYDAVGNLFETRRICFYVAEVDYTMAHVQNTKLWKFCLRIFVEDLDNALFNCFEEKLGKRSVLRFNYFQQ